MQHIQHFVIIHSRLQQRFDLVADKAFARVGQLADDRLDLLLDVLDGLHAGLGTLDCQHTACIAQVLGDELLVFSELDGFGRAHLFAVLRFLRTDHFAALVLRQQEVDQLDARYLRRTELCCAFGVAVWETLGHYEVVHCFIK